MTGFNGATTQWSWKWPAMRPRRSSAALQLQWGHDAVVVEVVSRYERLRSAMASSLQWGHDAVVVEVLAGRLVVASRSLLQWGHDAVVVEVANAATAPHDALELQWGHDAVVVEVDDELARGRPPSATLQWGHDAVVVEVLDVELVPPRRPTALQWGHDAVVVEVNVIAMSIGTGVDASMGPRRSGRGSGSLRSIGIVRLRHASMGPRRSGRGSVRATAVTPSAEVSVQWGHDAVVVEVDSASRDDR